MNDLRNIIMVEPENTQATVLLSKLLVAQSENTAAVKMPHGLLEIKPETTIIELNLANAYTQQGDSTSCT